MFDNKEIYRGLEVAQAMWGDDRFGDIPPSDLLAVIKETIRRSALDYSQRESSGGCC
jgi:hypothetical protein